MTINHPPMFTDNPFANRDNLPDVWGGAQLIALMDDWEWLCEKCVTNPDNPVHDDRDTADEYMDRDGWGVVGFTQTSEVELQSGEMCAHCATYLVDED